MNHLAHLALVPSRPLLQVGSLLGDFARSDDLVSLPTEVRAGIAHHRAVDRFTDAHPCFRRSCERIAPARRRYARVLVDVFYDHCLAATWERDGGRRPLAEFTTEVYRVLTAHEHLLPSQLRHALPRMIRNDWLGACRTLGGTATVLQRIAMRSRRGADLGAAIADLEQQREAFAADYAAFAPELHSFATRELERLLTDQSV